MLCAFLVFLFQPEVGKAQKGAGWLIKGVGSIWARNNDVDQDTWGRGDAEQGPQGGDEEGSTSIYELKVMRILCHTVQSRETGVIPLHICENY